MRIQSAVSGSERVFSFRLTRYELYEPSMVNICALPQTACRFLALSPLGASPMLLQARLDASCPSLLTVAGQQGLSAYRLVQILYTILCGMTDAEKAGFDSGNILLEPDQVFLSDAGIKPVLLYLPIALNENSVYNFKSLYQQLVPLTSDAQVLGELTEELMREGNTLENMKVQLEARMPRRKESSRRRRPEEENQITHFDLREKITDFNTQTHIRQTYAGRPEVAPKHPMEAFFKTFQKVLLILLGFALLCIALMWSTGISPVPYLIAALVGFAVMELFWLMLRRATRGEGKLKKTEWAHLSFCYPDGQMTSTPIPVDRTPFCIGRDPKWSQLTLTDGRVARKHASIIRKNGAFYLQDHNSTNGTTLNGCAVAPNKLEKLRNGDRISFADKTYRFNAS